MNQPHITTGPLFGRGAQQNALQGALARVAYGPSEVVLIDGPPGGGKSALARSLRSSVEGMGGSFLYGRFERFEQDRPYTGLADAFRGLIRRRLDGDPGELRAWRRMLEHCLEDEARVLIDVLPELGTVLPSAGSVPRLAPSEARARFNRLFRAFVGTLTTEGAPLVVCLDDLQWADEASLSAIQARVTDRRIRHMMLVATCRLDAETGSKPVARMLGALEDEDVPLTRMTLDPLGQGAVLDWLRAVVDSDEAPGEVDGIAERLISRTGGNPLYLKALFRRLRAEGILQTGSFSLAGGIVEVADALEGVDPDTLVAGAIDPLPAETQRLLQVAAALGGLFNVTDLAEIEGQSVASAQEILAPAIDGELIEGESTQGGLWYRFTHDAVQQVAYGALPDKERARIHRSAGQRLLSRTTNTRRDTRVFQVAFHMNQALGADPEGFTADDRYAVARMNRQAARIAKRDAAFKAALAHLQAAVQALPEDAWRSRYALTFELHGELLHAARAAEEDEAVEAAFAEALPHARTPLQRGGLYRVLILSRTIRGETEAARAAFVEAMGHFGVQIPSNDALMDEVHAMGRAIQKALKGQTLGSLLEAPQLTDPSQRMVTELLILGSTAQWTACPNWGLWVGSYLVRHAFEHGVSAATPFGMVCWPPRPRGDKQRLFESRRLAVELARRMDDPRILGRAASLAIVNGGFVGWDKDTCAALAREAFEICDAHQEPIYAAYALGGLTVVELLGSAPAARLNADARTRAAYVRSTGFEQALMEHKVARIATRRLLGREPVEHIFGGKAWSEEALIAELLPRPGFEVPRAIYLLTEARRGLVEGRTDEAWARLEEAESLVLNWEEGLCLPEMALLTGLTAAQLAYREERPEEMAGWRAHVQGALDRLMPYTDVGDEYTHAADMLQGELALLDNDPEAAWAALERAMEGAQAVEHLSNEVIASDRATMVAQMLHRPEDARRCLQASRDAALRWGAVRRATQIEAQISQPGLSVSPVSSSNAEDMVAIVYAINCRSKIGSAPLDIAAESIRARLDATRIIIARPQSGEWVVEGLGRDQSLSEEVRGHVPEALFDQVLRSGEAISATPSSDLVRRCPCAGRLTARPISVGGEVVGVIAIETRRAPRGGEAGEAELELITRIPELLAGAVESLTHQAALKKARRALDDLQGRLMRLEKGVRGRTRSYTLTSHSPRFQEVAARARQVSRSETAVLLKGEPGTGKGHVARAIHQLGSRQDAAFITLRGGRISPAELAAHFEMADGGTLYIEELGALEAPAQGELLRLMSGDELDARVIAATRHDLEALVSVGRFREDLYYQLSVFPLLLPPLRARMEDLPLAVDHMISQINVSMQRSLKGVAPEGMARLRAHRWPGNLFELQNVLTRAAMIYEEDDLLPIPEHLMPEDAVSGQSLGSYRLIEQLGHGGMGEVWRAQHQYLRRPAAIKLISSESMERSGGDTEGRQRLVRRFEREAQATAALRSPHSVELFDYGISDEGAFFYVMELLEGIDLQQMVERFGPLPAERVVDLMAQICRSLAEAHTAGLVHRDIKAANIYACRVGVEVDFVKVLDFGLVKHVGPIGELETGLTMEGVIQGTPAYMAPELALGDGEADHRVDLYALGCLGYWLLTGMLPFDAPNVMKLLMKHIQTPPVPPSNQVELEIPQALEDVIMSLLQKDPEARPQSARAVERALLAIPLEKPWDFDRAQRWWAGHLPDLAPARGVGLEPPI